jgi:hypothetical protein
VIDWLEHNLLTCFFKSNFGIECIGCGMQRALIELLKGNLSQSIQFNIGLIPFILTLITLIIQLMIKHPKGGFLTMFFFISTCILSLGHYIIKQIYFFQTI